MTTFKASVQYGDWEGTSAADDADQADLLKHLKDNKLINANEHLIATSLWVGENHGGKLGLVSARAYLYTLQNPNFATVKAALDATVGPIPVRIVNLEMSLEQYIGLFKRFDVMLTRRGFNLGGRGYV